MMYENFINEVSTKAIETRDEFIFQTISSWIVDKYQITVSKETLSKAVALVKMMEDRGVDICEITVNAKILHDEYMRGYRKGYREGRDVIVGNFKDKMKELKNEIAMQNNEKCCRCEFENMCFFAYVCLSDNYSFYLEKENLLND